MNKELGSNQIIGRDLCTLARLLSDYGLCTDTSSLENAGQACQYLPEYSEWNYNLDKIIFRIDEVGSRIPLNSTDLSASLSLEIKAGFVISEERLNDPLVHLKMDIVIEGLRENKEKQSYDDLYASWHLDRHIFEEGDSKTKYSHPMYHFTFGGEKMEEKEDLFGDCLILPSPRFCYPPMDAILGIDFILQNYLHKDKICEITSDPDYINLVKRAQERLLKPYFLSIASFWNDCIFGDKSDYILTEQHFSNKMLYPLFY